MNTKLKKACRLFIYSLILVAITSFSVPSISATDTMELLDKTKFYESPSKSNHPDHFPPQVVHVSEKQGDWPKVNTYLNNQRINQNLQNHSFSIQLLEVTTFYKKPNIRSAAIGKLAPQEVTVIQEDSGYFLIKTWLGHYWIKPQKYINEKGKMKLQLEKPYTIYDSQSLQSKTGAKVSPQTVTLVDETEEWWKIKTWLGEKYLYKNETEKVAYLTMDDGPNQHTIDILNILDDYQAKATFFMLEPNMRQHESTIKRMVDAGHFTALHSVTHDKQKLYARSPYHPVWEMEKGRKTLKEIASVDHYLVRMPYGSVPYMKDSFRNALVEHDFKMWDWTIDSNDWRYDSSTYEHIISNVKEQLTNVEKNGEPVVILLHDRAQTVQALPFIIEHLQQKGYQLKAYNPKEHIVVNFWNDSRL